MSFDDSLDKSRQVAQEEKEILDLLRERELDPIALRAAKSSLQVMIENCIGKAKPILQHYHCPATPHESRDALRILADCEAIDEATYRALHQAIGFRNVMIHDSMNFDPEALRRILRSRMYDTLYAFLIDECRYDELIRRRIENYAF